MLLLSKRTYKEYPKNSAKESEKGHHVMGQYLVDSCMQELEGGEKVADRPTL